MELSEVDDISRSNSGEEKVTEILKGILPRLHTLVIGPGYVGSSTPQSRSIIDIWVRALRAVSVDPNTCNSPPESRSN